MEDRWFIETQSHVNRGMLIDPNSNEKGENLLQCTDSLPLMHLSLVDS